MKLALAYALASIGSVAAGGCGGVVDDRPALDGSYAVTRSITQSDPCPDFAYPDAFDVDIDGGVVLVDNRAATVTADVDGRSFEFSAQEEWSSDDGFDAVPTLGYVINASADASTFSGVATTAFDFDGSDSGGDCSFTFDVEGARAAD